MFHGEKTLVNLKCRYCLKSIYIVTDGTEKCNKWWCWFRSASVQMASNLMWCPIASVCQRSWGVLSIWAPSVGDRFPIQGWGQHGSTGNRGIWSSPAASWLVQQALRVGASTGFFWLCRSLLGTPIEATQWLALKQCRSFDPKLIGESREVQGGAPWSANLLQFVV